MGSLGADFSLVLGAMETSRFGEIIRLTPRLYPVLMAVHVLGIALLVGPAIAVDLRLLGIGRDVLPVTVTAKYLLRLCHVGFTIVAVTGAAMFFGIAVQAGQSAAAPWKFGLILLALINILVFHKGIYRSVPDWDLHAPTPGRAKAAAVISACAWVGVVFAGRFLAY